MARRQQQKRARRAPRRKNLRRKRAPMRSDIASCTVTKDLGYDSMGVIYKLSEWSMAGYDRACSVAQNYQYYRITKAEFRFIPVSDTYIAGNPGELPNLYYVIDKSDSIPNVGTTVATLQSAGARPIRFDDKTITVSFKPAVVWKALDENGGAANFGMVKTSPWLATNNNNTSDVSGWTPSSVDHHGLVYTVQGGVSGANYRVEQTLHFEFKKPLYYANPAPGVGAVSKSITDIQMPPLPQPSVVA